MCEGERVAPEQHFGPLVAGQAAPGLVAVNGRGGTMGDIVVRSAHCAAHVSTWRVKKTGDTEAGLSGSCGVFSFMLPSPLESHRE